MLLIFGASFALIVYVYAIYPALLHAGALGRPRAWKRGIANPPLLTVIVPAHNEEASISAKIENLLASDYPRDRLEILVGSDGSSDRTEELVRHYERDGVSLVSFPQQHGKSAIQNGLAALAGGEILVFTDADCLFTPGTLCALIDNFADAAVGLVTARPVFENSGETGVTHNEGIYLRYETWLREKESERGLLALASGSLFAMRRQLWQPLDPAVGDDFALPLRVARAGFRNLLEPRAVVSTRLTQIDPRSMFRMKIRIIAKDFRALLANSALLDPFRYGATAVALCSHKLLRWFIPYFLIALCVSNVWLVRAPFFRACFAAQIAFYALAVAGVVLRDGMRTPIVTVPASFCIVNAAALFGTLSCLCGRTFSRWTPARTAQPHAPRLESPEAHT
jgi:cellulose synthase/poly-beta-1,6-N-acetylglucosamine synthase-like glycosyltransferase